MENIIDSKVKPEETDMCELHKIKMSYYCISCAKSICSDCAMFSEAHKSHEFAH